MPIVSWNSYADVSAYNRKLQQALAEAAGTTLRDHPEVLGIWLFGSRARGDFGARSDVDLLLMVERARPRRLDRPLDYTDPLDRFPAPVDLLVLAPAELQGMREDPSSAGSSRKPGPWHCVRVRPRCSPWPGRRARPEAAPSV